MSKTSIAIVSMLKPVNDIRSYEKMAKTIAAAGAYSVTLLGAKAGDIKPYSSDENIAFKPLPQFKRLGFKRLFMPLIVLQYLIKLKPKVVIVNTFELLIVTIVNQIIFGGKTVYDLQENYYRNLVFQNNYPPVIKHILGVLIRLKELLLSPFIHHFILAEKGYKKELGFVGKRFSIIENKAMTGAPFHKTRTANDHVKFLFTGNLSENSGVMNALSFYNKIQKEIPNASFTIIGHCPSSSFSKKLQATAGGTVELIASPTPIEHSKITDQIRQSDFGIVSYQLNPSNENCMPTKVFEYLANGLPVISQTGTLWTDFSSTYDVCIPVDFEQVDVEKVTDQLKKFLTSYDPKDIPEVRWETEEKKLIDVVNKLSS